VIDFLKIELPYKLIPKLSGNSDLEFKGNYCRSSGEVFEYPLTAKYKSLKFIIRSQSRLELHGSIHKYWSGGYNFSDYTYPELLDTVVTLYEKFQINPFEAILRNVEFGVNIQPIIASKSLISKIINYKGKPLAPMSGSTRNNLGIKCVLQQKTIKIYDKKKQWPPLIQDETMRFEIKANKMELLKKLGIKYLSDLINPAKLFPLGQLLTSTFNDLILIDNSIDVGKLNASQERILNEWSNPKYLEELETKDRSKFNYERRRLRDIQSIYSKEKIQEKIASLIRSKWNELSDIDDETYTKLTNFINQFTDSNPQKSYTNLTNFSDQDDDCSSYQINHSNSRLNRQEKVLIKEEKIPFAKYVESLKYESGILMTYGYPAEWDLSAPYLDEKTKSFIKGIVSNPYRLEKHVTNRKMLIKQMEIFC